MRPVIYFATYLFLLQIVLVPLHSQAPFEDENGVMREMVFSPDYKTIQLYREGWTESYPISRLQGDVPLVLEFDDLSRDQPTLLYRVIHCNADWTQSDISEQEFLEGYPENEIPGGAPKGKRNH